LEAAFPGWSALTRLDPGLISITPAGVKRGASVSVLGKIRRNRARSMIDGL
jgi:hypothetical protein